jgi:hypothetical protein
VSCQAEHTALTTPTSGEWLHGWMLAGLLSWLPVLTNCRGLSYSCSRVVVAFMLAAGLPLHSCSVAAVGTLASGYAPGVVALAAGSQLRSGLTAVRWCLD